MTRAGDLAARFAEACPDVDGLAVGQVVAEAVWHLGLAPATASGRRWSRLAPAFDVLRAAREWGWREGADRLLDRFDPSHSWGAGWLPRAEAGPVDLLCTSTYENTARAMLRYASHFPRRPALAAWRFRAARAWEDAGGPGAFGIASFLAGRARASRDRSARIAVSLRQGLAAIRPTVAGDERKEAERLGTLLEGPIARAVGGFTVAFEKALDSLGPRAVAVGNEFAYTDRAALLIARRAGLQTVAFAHGIFDHHYRDLPVLADLFVTWGGASARFVRESGVSDPARVAAIRPEWSVPAPAPARSNVVVFSQPVQFSRVDTSGYHQGVRRVCEILHATGRHVFLKPHPLEDVSVWKGIAAEVLGRTVSAAALLRQAGAALLLDSSVVVDALLARVPVVGIGWCDSVYGERFEREGWMRRARTPEEAAECIRAIVGFERDTADPFSGEGAGDGERLRALLRGRAPAPVSAPAA